MMLKPKIFMIMVLMVSISVHSRSQTEIKQQRKEKEETERNATFENAKRMIKDTCFMIRVDQVIGAKNMNLGYVSDRLCFLTVSKKDILAQLVPYRTKTGLGGITMEGKVERYEIKEKDNRLFLTLYMRHRLGFQIFNINLNGDDVALINGASSGKVGKIDESDLIVGIRY